MKQARLFLMVGLLIGMLMGGIAVGSFSGLVQAQDQQTLAPEDVVAQVGPAVVTVLNEQRTGDLGSNSLQPVGSGTGFIIDNQGHIVTNWHVVQGGEQFAVVLQNGESRPAKLVGSDRLSDLAVVQIDGDLPGIVQLGDSSALRPGQAVLAIGSPLGSFTNTVTAGIVSATSRDFPAEYGAGDTYTNLIQHDAAINPGKSGGPLFNLRGEVVGVNTLGIPMDNSGQPVQGLFFAIPSNQVQKIATELIQNGAVTYPYLGISFDTITPDIAAQYSLPVKYGAYVQEVTANSPAADAGLQPNDIITSIGEDTIDPNTTFSEALFRHQPGETVTLEVVRGSSTISIDVTLGERPANT